MRGSSPSAVVVLDSGINTVTRRQDETSWGEAEVAEIHIYGDGVHDDSFDNRDKMTVLETLIEQETLRRGAVEAPEFNRWDPVPSYRHLLSPFLSYRP